MNRKRVIASALVAVALSATVAAAANAAVFKFTSDPTLLKGIHEGSDEFSFISGAFKCSIAEFGTALNVPTKESKEVTAAPTYKECMTTTSEIEFKKNSCWWDFISGALIGNNYEGEVEVKCTNAKEGFEFIKKEKGVLKCTIHIPAQAKLTTVTYTNKTDAGGIKDLTFDIGITGLTYTQTEGTGLGKCVTETRNDGKYTATWTVQATDNGGKSNSWWIE